MSARLTPLGICFAVIALVAICGSALAYFSANGTGTASAAVGTLTTPKITAATAEAGGKVKLTWSAATVPGGTVTYFVERDGGPAGGNCPSEAAPSTVLTCTDTELSIAAHEFTVTAVYRTWSRTSTVATATVTVGVATQFSVAASTTTPAAGAAVNLTITALDEKGSKVTTFTGTHNLVFSGTAPASPSGQAATVANASGTALKYGETTALTFTTGASTVSSSKNGVLKLYKVGEATITASEGSITDPTPVQFNVVAAALSKFTVTTDKSSVVVGEEIGLTITAFDVYGNLATNYVGSHKLTFSPTGTSPAGNVATVADETGSPVAIGTATSIFFTEGVAEAAEGANGEVTYYKSGSYAIKAAEGTPSGTATAVTVNPAPAASMKMTASATSVAASASVTLTMTALDEFGNTATGYSGSKNLVFSGAAASPSGQAPTVTNQSGTAVNFGTATPLTFASGTKTATLKLYNAGSYSVTMTDGTFTTAPIAFTVTATTAARVAWLNVTASAGTVSPSCFLTCTVTGVGNSGTVKGNLEIVDTYGNVVSNYGASKTGTVTASIGTVTGGSLTFPETGPAVSPTQFTFTYPSTGTTNATLTGASTSRTSVTATVTK